MFKIAIIRSRFELQQSIFSNECQLHLHYAGAQNLSPGVTFFNPLHNDPDVTELLMICEGGGTYQFDGKIYEAEAHSVLFYNQGLWHEERSFTYIPYVTMYLGFSGLRLNGLPPGFFIDRQLSPVFKLKDNFFETEQRLREILHVKNTPDPESQWVANHLLSVFLGELARLVHHRNIARPQVQSTFKAVSLCKKFMHENYSQPISLQDLSKQAHLSPFHLSRVFKKETGLSPIQYLMKYRIEAAKQYLKSTNETIAIIAERVGYESETQFQHMFKRISGLTPGKYRTSI
jgi:AraC-like DNA-binding protein/mannose-6-phosphate isomerase-like protein (cupin superfamily)